MLEQSLYYGHLQELARHSGVQDGVLPPPLRGLLQAEWELGRPQPGEQGLPLSVPVLVWSVAARRRRLASGRSGGRVVGAPWMYHLSRQRVLDQVPLTPPRSAHRRTLVRLADLPADPDGLAVALRRAFGDLPVRLTVALPEGRLADEALRAAYGSGTGLVAPDEPDAPGRPLTGTGDTWDPAEPVRFVALPEDGTAGDLSGDDFLGWWYRTLVGHDSYLTDVVDAPVLYAASLGLVVRYLPAVLAPAAERAEWASRWAPGADALPEPVRHLLDPATTTPVATLVALRELGADHLLNRAELRAVLDWSDRD